MSIEMKIFNDPVHGTMMFPPKLVEVIDTPQFQRLRNIKQLGTVYHVYPGASHNRFEHSLGTAHLAGKFIRMLQSNQPELKISEDDVLCVEIAGLCHDLGHGPFSHMFDQMVVSAVGGKNRKWKHEQGSCDMFDYILTTHNIQLSKDAELHDTMVKIIKLMIKPPKENARQEDQSLVKDKPFLYEIISNERNKVDVDKWDYFARDCHQLGIRNSFDHDRFMRLCRVIEVDGDKIICAHEKECKNLYEMFHTRAALHKRAYQHRISVAVDLMICDAFISAEKNGFRFGGHKMSEVMNYMEVYTEFDDNIIDRIMQTDLENSKTLLRRIKERKFYRFVGSEMLTIKEKDKYGDEIENKIRKKILNNLPEDTRKAESESVAVHLAKFDYGMKRDNPCEKFKFYSKKNPDKAVSVDKKKVSEMLPSVFEEYEIQVFYKKFFKGNNSQDSIDLVHAAFIKWQESKII